MHQNETLETTEHVLHKAKMTGFPRKPVKHCSHLRCAQKRHAESKKPVTDILQSFSSLAVAFFRPRSLFHSLHAISFPTQHLVNQSLLQQGPLRCVEPRLSTQSRVPKTSVTSHAAAGSRAGRFLRLCQELARPAPPKRSSDDASSTNNISLSSLAE